MTPSGTVPYPLWTTQRSGTSPRTRFYRHADSGRIGRRVLAAWGGAHFHQQSETMNQVVIVDNIRTGLAKAHRGTFNLTRADALVAHCIDCLLYTSPSPRD